MCMAHVHDVTKKHNKEEWESTKDDSQESYKRRNWV